MKLTKSKLKQIIKEELGRVLGESASIKANIIKTMEEFVKDRPDLKLKIWKQSNRHPWHTEDLDLQPGEVAEYDFEFTIGSKKLNKSVSVGRAKRKLAPDSLDYDWGDDDADAWDDAQEKFRTGEAEFEDSIMFFDGPLKDSYNVYELDSDMEKNLFRYLDNLFT
jgi:hypothetical protein